MLSTKTICSCRKSTSCKVRENRCLEKDTFYTYSVTTPNKICAYVWVASRTLKARKNDHLKTFRNPNLINAASLSKLIGTLKQEVRQYTIKREVIGKPNP